MQAKSDMQVQKPNVRDDTDEQARSLVQYFLTVLAPE
jgi:hypothetical protein